MNWKRTKTLFIIVFLLVNICLLLIYVDKIKKSQVSDAENDNAVHFEQENIKIPKNVPNSEGIQMELITARSKSFKKEAEAEDKAEVSDNGYTISKDMSEAVDVKQDPIVHLKPYIDQNIYKGNTYQYHETKDGRIYYEQTYQNYPIMNNNRATLSFEMEDESVKRYAQSAMEDIRPSKGSNNQPRNVISARDALEALYFNQYLKSGDEVLSMRLGYYTVVKETNVQVLQPNWEVTVKSKNDTHTYYVEAVSQNPQITE
ncbi:two-component system regulatory protein YycI [Staphylococcus canis]|uniref:Regulatory protein YycH-like domain-containing protein n=1 Tax=Staphylococcus canis TaxID=2724942 RepID=A0ABS0T8B8_9STAP|nr:two-component system regulatory protein YycI [Staphylococcus canis]MBI5974994.1 hypothetical protein [Staphylococcus canis]